MTDHKTADKTPDPISSEQAQKGTHRAKGETLERPNPNTETVDDKVITPTSIKETERQTDAINEQAAKVERKLGH